MSVPQPQPLIDTSFDVGFADRLARYETYNLSLIHISIPPKSHKRK